MDNANVAFERQQTGARLENRVAMPPFNLSELLNPAAAAPAAPPPSKAKSAKDIVPADYTQPFLDFINQNPTVFHAVDYFCKRLQAEGFTALKEGKTWYCKLKPGGKYYVTRNGSSLVAFSIPTNYTPGEGFGGCPALCAACSKEGGALMRL